jgi:hypothetical protein
MSQKQERQCNAVAYYWLNMHCLCLPNLRNNGIEHTKKTILKWGRPVPTYCAPYWLCTWLHNFFYSEVAVEPPTFESWLLVRLTLDSDLLTKMSFSLKKWPMRTCAVKLTRVLFIFFNCHESDPYKWVGNLLEEQINLPLDGFARLH